MSWLFDQLTDLAVADRVDVVVRLDVARVPSGPGSIDVADLFARAARLPNTTLLLLPASPADAPLPLDSAETIDVDVMQPGPRVRAVGRMLAQHGRSGGAVVRAGEGRMSLEPYGSLPARDRLAAGVTTRGTVAWMVATEQPPDQTDPFEKASAAGLRISIGSLNPTSNVMIADAVGFVALLDAMVTLREFAVEALPPSSGEGAGSLPIADAG